MSEAQPPVKIEPKLKTSLEDYKKLLQEVEDKASSLADYLAKLKERGVVLKTASTSPPTPIAMTEPPSTPAAPSEGTVPPPASSMAIPLSEFILYEILSPLYIVDMKRQSLLDHLFGSSRPSRV